MLRGKLQAAIRRATERENVGLLKPSDLQPVVDVLCVKHPETNVLYLSNPNAWSATRNMTKVSLISSRLTSVMIAISVAKQLCGGAGPSGVGAWMLKDWFV